MIVKLRLDETTLLTDNRPINLLPK